MLQQINWCVFTTKQTYTTGIVNLLYVRNDTKKNIYYNDLENCMLSVSHTSNCILRWLKIFTLLY